jgi:hypothetical protein
MPAELQALIRQMAHDNPTGGQERIATDLRSNFSVFGAVLNMHNG